MQNLLSYLLSHFECRGHTVHLLTLWCLPSPLTSTGKSSLFVLAQSSPLSLAATLHQCQGKRLCYINNGWTFCGQKKFVTVGLFLGAWLLQVFLKQHYFRFLFPNSLWLRRRLQAYFTMAAFPLPCQSIPGRTWWGFWGENPPKKCLTLQRVHNHPSASGQCSYQCSAKLCSRGFCFR